MAHPYINLTYLERLYKGDRSRMAQWIGVYLEEAPAQYARLSDALTKGDVQGLIAAAHDLRPQAHYVGATRIHDLLVAIGQRARNEGAMTCEDPVREVISISQVVSAELQAWMSA